MAGRDAPADLHRGREARLEAHPHQADQPDQAGRIAPDHAPEAEAVLGVVRRDPGEPGVALRPVHRLGEMPHRTGVAVDGGQFLCIGGLRGPQDQPRTL
jgi:hypothetical protein